MRWIRGALVLVFFSMVAMVAFEHSSRAAYPNITTMAQAKFFAAKFKSICEEDRKSSHHPFPRRTCECVFRKTVSAAVSGDLANHYATAFDLLGGTSPSYNHALNQSLLREDDSAVESHYEHECGSPFDDTLKYLQNRQ